MLTLFNDGVDSEIEIGNDDNGSCGGEFPLGEPNMSEQESSCFPNKALWLNGVGSTAELPGDRL